MRQRLHIGEVAQLLGVTPKTIRHYQKIGLLPEPERTRAGYRLYSVHDLLRLRHIRHLQELGLSLKQIKLLLGDPSRAYSLREALQALDDDIETQMLVLQERRKRIRGLLEQDELASADQLTLPSPTLERVKAILGDLTSSISPALWAQEARIESLLDSFRWPAEYQSGMEQVLQYIVAHPEIYRHWIIWGERIAALASLPPDAPEVAQLIADCTADGEFAEFQRQIMALSEHWPQLEEQFAHVMSDLLSTTLTPAQRRFFEAIARKTSLPASNI